MEKWTKHAHPAATEHHQQEVVARAARDDTLHGPGPAAMQAHRLCISAQ